MTTTDVDMANDTLPSDQTSTENAEAGLKRPHEEASTADKGEQVKEELSPPETSQKEAHLDSQADSSNNIVPSAYNKLRSQELLPERYVRQVLVLKPQGGLGSFKGLKQLVTIFKDYSECINRLREDVGMVHGDIMPSHLKISKDGRGVIVDWDMPGVGNWRML